MPVRAVLFDLDETLIEEDAVVADAFAATAALARERAGADPARLAAAARVQARERWREAPAREWAVRIGVSSWEALHCRFAGERPELAALRAWAPGFRRAAWGAALAEQEIDDPELADALAARFAVERAAHQRNYADAAPALEALRGRVALGLVTNGASCFQRDKLRDSGFGAHFESVVVSADVDAGKPEPAAFLRAIDELGIAPEEAVMVGDNLERDVEGALSAGLQAVWLNRRGDERAPAAPTIRSLADLSV